MELLGDADYRRWIGDKGVRTPEDARRYLDEGPLASYTRHGFGLYLVARRDDSTPVGYCGLLRREALPVPDLGFALLPAHRGRGYTLEAARAILAREHDTHGISRVGAIVLPGNAASIRVLGRLGLASLGRVHLDPDPAELLYFEGPVPSIAA